MLHLVQIDVRVRVCFFTDMAVVTSYENALVSPKQLYQVPGGGLKEMPSILVVRLKISIKHSPSVPCLARV